MHSHSADHHVVACSEVAHVLPFVLRQPYIEDNKMAVFNIGIVIVEQIPSLRIDLRTFVPGPLPADQTGPLPRACVSQLLAASCFISRDFL